MEPQEDKLLDPAPRTLLAGCSVLMVITDTDRRGAQVFATDLADGFTDLGIANDVVALAEGSTGGLDVEALGPSRRHPRTALRLRAAIQRADVVVAHGSTTLPMCALAGTGVSTPFVYRQISDSRFWAPSGWKRVRTSAAMRRARRIVALWDGAAKHLTEHLGVPPHRIDVIPNGVPSERYAEIGAVPSALARGELGIPAEPWTAGYIGALAEEKGVDIVIRSVEHLDAHLLIAGDGPARGELEALADLVAPGRVHFLGPLTDPRPAYAAADAVVLASRGGDSMPAVLIEAAFAQRPVIATPIDAIPQIVLDEQTGLLVPVEDVAALRAALQRLITDRDLSGTLTAAAEIHCLERFDIAAVARQWAGSCAEALGEAISAPA